MSSSTIPYLNAVNWLFENNSDFDWLIDLTGQDYPTQPLSETENFLASTDCDGFISYWDIFADQIPWNRDKGFKRYYFIYWRMAAKSSYLFLKNFQQLSIVKKMTWLKFYLTYGPLVGIPCRSTPFNNEFICYGVGRGILFLESALNISKILLTAARSLLPTIKEPSHLKSLLYKLYWLIGKLLIG